MKRLEEYTDEELYALDEVEREQLVDLECAHRGVPLLPPSPSAPDKPEGKPDVTIYEVSPPSLYFATKEQAETVIAFLNGLDYLEAYSLQGGYSYSGPYGVRSPEDPPTASINERQHWSPTHYDKNKAALEQYESAKSTHDTQRREYDSVQGQRANIVNEFQRRVDKHAQDLYDKQRIQADFDRYMTLADGNRETALKFLLEVSKYEEDFIRAAVGMELPMAVESPPDEEF